MPASVVQQEDHGGHDDRAGGQQRTKPATGGPSRRKGGGSSSEKERMPASLKVARGRSGVIEPRLCTDYSAAWRANRITW
jgi:hypothetical protein